MGNVGHTMKWVVNNTSGLGSNYKSVVRNMAEDVSLHLGQKGSLYYAKRLSDSGGNHHWRVRVEISTVNLQYEMELYTRYSSVQKEEQGAGYHPDGAKRIYDSP